MKLNEEPMIKEGNEPIIELGNITFPDNPPILKPPLPFSQRFQKKKLDSQFFKFLEIFKKIHINFPFADALEQMPNYAKLMKDVMSKKRHLEE